MTTSQQRQDIIGLSLVLGAALLVRFTVASHPYSGAGVSPQYGDYEAQRHWMELSVNLPVSEWYSPSADNNLTYWGLDYPPLSGYQSWLFGKAIQALQPDAVALHTSQGYETPHSKFLMRLTVIASDLLVFFPAILLCLRVFASRRPVQQRQWWLALVLLQPAALLIDHGHFQYNNISLGFAAGAAGAIAAGHDCWGSVLFCLSLNHKQMSMYYAPAFFAHLLGKCLQKPTWMQKASSVIKLGLVVIASFAVCWAPFLAKPGAAVQLLQRLVPVKRGLYEDYVANFWCVTSPAFKWRRAYSQQALVKMCAGASLTAALPSMIHQIVFPSPKGLLMGMANSALAFFLFSYQVHEKSIMLALLPVTLLALDEHVIAAWLPFWSTLSMFPLLKKDGLGMAYLACLLLWLAIAPPPSSLNLSTTVQKSRQPDMGQRQRSLGGRLAALSWQSLLHYASMLLLVPAAITHAAQCIIAPPAKYLHLYDAAFVTMSFMHIASVAMYLSVAQWSSTQVSTSRKTRKHD